VAEKKTRATTSRRTDQRRRFSIRHRNAGSPAQRIPFALAVRLARANRGRLAPVRSDGAAAEGAGERGDGAVSVSASAISLARGDAARQRN
jgi:hypothetical protein